MLLIASLSQVPVPFRMSIPSEPPQDAEEEYDDDDPFLVRMRNVAKWLAFVESRGNPIPAAPVTVPQPAPAAAKQLAPAAVQEPTPAAALHPAPAVVLEHSKE